MEWEEKLIWNYSTTAVGDNPALLSAHLVTGARLHSGW